MGEVDNNDGEVGEVNDNDGEVGGADDDDGEVKGANDSDREVRGAYDGDGEVGGDNGSDGEVGKADDDLEEGKAKDNDNNDVDDSYHAEALTMLASIEEKFALLRDCVHLEKMEFMLLEAELAANGEFFSLLSSISSFSLTRNNTLSSPNPLPNCGLGFLILTYTTYHVKLLTLTYNA